jgi:hypothetical protein
VRYLEAFDRHETVEARISRLPHFSHTPGAEERKNLIRTESVAGAQHGELRRSLYHSSAVWPADATFSDRTA